MDITNIVSLNRTSDFLLSDGVTACNTTVEVGLSFGSQNWSISPADFQLMDIGGGYCIGAFFELSTSSPSWIIGDTFLVGPTKCSWSQF